MVGNWKSGAQSAGNRSRRGLLRSLGAGIAGSTIIGTGNSSARDPSGQGPESQAENFELAEGPPIAVERVASGLTSPVQFAAPGTGRQYIADQTGQIHVLGPNGLSEEPFLDISHRIVQIGENLPDYLVYDERGLLGLAFHPDYPADPRFYVRYSAPFVTGHGESHTEVLAEYTASDEVNAEPNSERILLAIPQPSPIHQAGTIEFGPKDYLYVALGDGGWASNAQELEYNLLGSILRIDVDGGSGGDPYGIPSDNPLVDKPGKPEYFAWGFRNPWRMSFYEGNLLAADVGEGRYEEINLVLKGQNYGWPIKEGTYCYNSESAENCREKSDTEAASVDGLTSLVDPATQFPRAVGDEVIGLAVVGGDVYDRKEIPNLQGMYVFGNYTHGWDDAVSRIFATPITSDEELWPISELPVVNAPNNMFNRNILSFGQDPNGHLYILTTRTPLSKDPFVRDDGEVFRLIEPAKASPI